MRMFEEGCVSLGKAAELAGVTRRTHAELLGRGGISVFGYSADSPDREIAALDPPASA